MRPIRDARSQPNTPMAPRRRFALAPLADPRLVGMAALGYASGLPLVLTGSTLALFLADRGVAIETIGLFSLVGLPYTLKPLWAPALDRWRIPLIGPALGRRRSWIVLVQALLVAAVVALGAATATSGALAVALIAILVAVLSASQDIAIDAFRVESFDTEAQAAAMAVFVAAYRVALVAGGAGTVLLVALVEGGPADAASGSTWAFAYAVSAVTIAVGGVAALFMGEPATRTAPSVDAAGRPARGFATLVIDPLKSFAQTPGWPTILAFVALFKLGDALAGSLVGPFALHLGFDKATIATVNQGVGLAATLAGGAVGGLLAPAVPLVTALWIAGLLQMVTNLAFTGLALVGPSTPALVGAVAIEAFAGGIGTVLFVAFLSGLCRDPAHTATHYALLSALSALGRTLFSAAAGFLAAAAGWPAFFALTALAALPGLALLAVLPDAPFLRRRVDRDDARALAEAP